MQGYHGKSLVFFLSKGVKINDKNDSKLLYNVFENEEPLLRVILLFTYSLDSNLPNFSSLCMKSNCEEVKEFINYFNEFSQINSNSNAEASFLSYLKVKTPKWEEEYSKVENQYETTIEWLNKLVSLNLELNENYSITASKLIEFITNFMDNFKKCKFLMSQINGTFSDYPLFLDDSEDKIKNSISFLENSENSEIYENFFNSLYEKNEMEVFVHFAIVELLNKNKENAISFLKTEINHISSLRESIPDFNSFFDKYRIALKKLEPTLESKLFQQFNTFYHFVHAKESVLFAKSKLAEFALKIINEENKNELKSTDELLLRTFQTFKLFCASMGMKRPELSEEKSEYKMTEDEVESICMKKELIETEEIDEEISFIDEGIQEMNKFSSICTVCHKYCASYVCPFCYVCLYCLLCKKDKMFCPACGKFFEEPMLIKKTHYIGDEFRIDLLNRRAQAEKEKESKK